MIREYISDIDYSSSLHLPEKIIVPQIQIGSIYISDQLINIEHRANHGKNIYPLVGYMGISCSNHIYVELIKMLS